VNPGNRRFGRSRFFDLYQFPASPEGTSGSDTEYRQRELRSEQPTSAPGFTLFVRSLRGFYLLLSYSLFLRESLLDGFLGRLSGERFHADATKITQLRPMGGPFFVRSSVITCQDSP
jgi:hypothetical protein